MATTTKHQLRVQSASASPSRVSIAKTPLERMLRVMELGRRGHLIEKLANNGRADADRAR